MKSAIVWASAVVLTMAAPAAVAQPVSLDSLLQSFRKLPGLQASYREEQHLSLLAEPLVSTGTIHFAPPDHLARHTLSPVKSSVVVDGHEVRFGTAQEHDSVDLDGNPVAKLFVETFLRILAGDRTWLVAHYDVALQGRKPRTWALELSPKAAPMKGIVREIDLWGHDLVVERMKIVEASGDDLVTTFSDVDVRKKYTPDEMARVFRLWRR